MSEMQNNLLPLSNLVEIAGDNIDPRHFTGEVFELFSIPAFDEGKKPEIINGESIGSVKRIVQCGDCLFSKLNPRINRVWVVPAGNGHRQIATPEFWALRVKPGVKLSPLYLSYLLSYSAFREAVIGREEAATKSRSRLKPEQLLSKKIPLPSPHKQERIVRILDEANKLRRLRAQADSRTAELVPAIFHKMFGDPEHTTLPVKPLISLIRDDRPITYGILKPGANIPDGVPYVRVLDIKQGRLNINELHKTTNEIAQQYRRSILQPGDILVTIRGTVGRTCIVPNDLQGANITQDTVRLAPTDEVVVLYLIEFLNTPWTQGWMSHHIVGQAVKGINLGDVKKIPVPLPPLPLQQQFAARVAEVRALEESQAASRRKLDALFDSLLHRAFRGNL
jgi:type I restriction enzyme S subunit